MAPRFVVAVSSSAFWITIIGWWICMVPILSGRFVVERHFLRVVHACWLGHYVQLGVV